MNAYDRLNNRMDGKPVDRLPNMCLVMAFAAKQMGIPYGNYVTDYRLLSEGVLRCYEKFHLDMLCVISDPMREAEGLGAEIVIPEDDVPYSKIKRIQNLKNIDTLKLIEPSKSHRMNDRLEAVSFLSERSQGEVNVAGWVEGAVADIVDLDYMVDIEKAAGLFPETMCICGNFDPVSVLLQGTPEIVKQEVSRCHRIEGKNRSIIAAGCEVPKFTPNENLLAVWEGNL